MIGGGEVMLISSMWSSISSWFTPTVLFCVLNLMIGTIFIASNFRSPSSSNNNSNKDHHHNFPTQLARAPSMLLERVKSVNFPSFYTTPDDQPHHQYRDDLSEATSYNSTTQLARAPSLLERVKSINLSSFNQGGPQSHYHNHPSQSESEQPQYESVSQLARAPSLLERVKSINFNEFYPFHTESEQMNNSPDQLERTPSLLDRVKSFKISSPFKFDHHAGDDFADQHEHVDQYPHLESDHHVVRSKSEKSGVSQGKKTKASMKKSRSEIRVMASSSDEEDVDRRRPATMREKGTASFGAEDDEVDAKADDFINRFKQQLKLQRLDSFVRFKEMLNRGT